MRAIGVLVITLFSVSLALASDLQPFKVKEVVEQQQQIRTEMMAGKGRYADMPSHRRSDVLNMQDRLFRMLDGKESSEDLSEDQYMEAFAALESIEAIVNNEGGERLVCTREKTLGSNRTKRVCRTQSQIDAERELARGQMNQGIDQLRRGN
jgi:hypothetical protein